MKLLALLLALGCAGALAAVSLARTSATALVGTVGPGFSIKLTKDGQAVTHLEPGDYTITVHDLSEEHDFHLAGGGISKATSVEGTGDETWEVTLGTDSYVFFCDAHAATMLGKFTVGDVPVTTTTRALTSTLAARAVGRTLVVGATASRPAKLDLSVLLAGKKVAHASKTGTSASWRVKVAKAGRYVVRMSAAASGSTVVKSKSVTVR
jgi:hypothetical protein